MSHKLTQVDASGNVMGTNAVKALGDVQHVNKSIRHLNVSDNVSDNDEKVQIQRRNAMGMSVVKH